ncbi:right-handed parallel beta-helix repeat-containing protein [Actinoplanes sp. CA-142083]|uniref:right-handed parallel beta-helix repeat-containing protein n=1 Tax=Actinoplanes sp. CA-142083 TaxID=3239903 RepID=UPI003D93D72C
MLLDVTDFGSLDDAGPAIRAALRVARATPGPVVLRFPPGEYHVWPQEENRRELYVSNTVGADPRHRIKTVAILIESIDDLLLTGEGARLVVHGLQTTFAVLDSARVRVEGLEFDYAVPTVVDATVADAGPGFRLIRVPAVTRFTVTGRSVLWHGEPTPAGGFAWWGRNGLDYTQVFDVAAGRARRVDNPLFRDVAAMHRVGEREVRIEYGHRAQPYDMGLVYAMRRTVRDHPGALITGSADVTLSRLRFRYLHGFGVVAQHSRDLTVEDCEFRPPPGTRRHSAGFADFLQVSGCSGRVVVRDSVFDGSHDDPINVHGTYLRVAEQPRTDTLLLQFAHPETAGLAQFTPGERFEVVDRATLRPVAEAGVRDVRQPGDPGEPLTSIVLTADVPLPAGLAGVSAVENVSRTPSVEITGNVFRNTPTRAVLVTTRRPIRIERNRFERPGMAAIYVSADANEWWESGPVRDLTIRANEFIDPGGPAILVDPRAPRVDEPVHSGILIEENRFELDGVPAVDATATSGLRLHANASLPATATTTATAEVRFTACRDVVID